MVFLSLQPPVAFSRSSAVPCASSPSRRVSRPRRHQPRTSGPSRGARSGLRSRTFRFSPCARLGLGHCFEKIQGIHSVVGSNHGQTEGLEQKSPNPQITQQKARAEEQSPSVLPDNRQPLPERAPSRRAPGRVLQTRVAVASQLASL